MWDRPYWIVALLCAALAPYALRAMTHALGRAKRQRTLRALALSEQASPTRDLNDKD